MPTSSWQHIPYFVDLIRRINPSTILDIGAGFGRWGILSREFLEVWSGRIFRKDWRIVIEGIEVFEEYIDVYHEYFYNKIYIGDAFDEIDRIRKEYDLIIIGDVLEHFAVDKAKVFLLKCLKKSQYVLLSIPLGTDWEQENIGGNEYERHLSFWTVEDVLRFPCKRARLFTDYIGRTFGVFLLSENTNGENITEIPQNATEELTEKNKQIAELHHTLRSLYNSPEWRVFNRLRKNLFFRRFASDLIKIRRGLQKIVK